MPKKTPEMTPEEQEQSDAHERELQELLDHGDPRDDGLGDSAEIDITHYEMWARVNLPDA